MVSIGFTLLTTVCKPNTAGILTHGTPVPQFYSTVQVNRGDKMHTEVSVHISLLSVKYRNGGCSGFEPDYLFIYSANNFSNRI